MPVAENKTCSSSLFGSLALSTMSNASPTSASAASKSDQATTPSRRRSVRIEGDDGGGGVTQQQERTLQQHHHHTTKKKPLSLGRVSKRAVMSSKRKVGIYGCCTTMYFYIWGDVGLYRYMLCFARSNAYIRNSIFSPFRFVFLCC
jgi:hypothetical protein